MAGSNFDWVEPKLYVPPRSLIGADGYPTDPQERIAAGGTIFYNIEMAKKIREIKKPVKGLVLDIKLRPNYIALVVYEDNVMEYEIDQRADIMEYLLKVRDFIQSYGVRCELEGAKGRAKPTY